MMKRPLATLAKAARSFWQDTDGVILPYVTVMLVVIVGTSLLALDGARYMSLQSQLQKGADALAIAGAAELDRMPDSTTRAVNAINNLITNSSVFGTGGTADVTDFQIRFMRSLPADNVLNVGAPHFLCTGNACTPEDSVFARFVEVTVTPTQILTVLPASFLPGGPANTVTAGAQATAGMDQVVCEFTPMFICNPYSTPEMSYDAATAALQAAVADPATRRRQIAMRAGGGGDAQYSPGNYGFLSSATLGNGANALRDAIGMESPNTCFKQSGVDTQPGFIATAREAVNVRFDIYERSMGGARNNADFRPAMNVRKGYLPPATGSACNAAPAAQPPPPEPQAMGMPRDNCFAAANCPHMGGRMGDGEWDFDKYWRVNHTLPDGLTQQDKPLVNGAEATNLNLPSRWDVYLYELYGATPPTPLPTPPSADANPFMTNRSGQASTTTGGPITAGEKGAPICQTNASPNPDRRTFFAAIVNCQADLPPSLPLQGGRQIGVPVAAFGKFFVTQPVEVPQDQIMAELIELVDAESDAFKNFDQVQLFR